ncbi:DNA sulfur modification protein DndB [Streptomyces sp. AC495_CC817]|uniref:DNA sulfur modification protein DndB n=1 Tax=Streptomyces sp. AC495_CC817 TaxID=2823900 RepID=UPI001C2728D3|nr:DNA sulfur modification protein DndB [Streptomyces sp. AC495_CC817]
MTTATSAPVATGLTTEERIYATRYKQGGRTVFSLTLSPAELINMVAQPNPNIPNPGNRAIRENHARAFAEYYLEHESWVIPGIILRAPSVFKFEDNHDNGWGVLSYPKRSAMNIQILDGQHRILGFHHAASMIQQRIEKARDQRARAMRVEDGNKSAPAVREAEAQLKAAYALEERFASERVAVEIQVTDDTSVYRQMFFDIADNALGITASVRARFDTRKVANRALSVVLEHPLLDKRVDLENDRIARQSPYYASARHVSDMIRAVQVGLDGRIGKVMEKTMNEIQVAADAKKFLDLAVASFPQLGALQVGQISPQTLRESSLLGSPAMLRVLGGVFHELTSDRHAWTAAQVGEFFETLEPHMAGGAYAGSIWLRIESEDGKGNKQKAFTEGAFSPNGRRQDLVAVEKTLVDWAILGKVGAPFVWDEPAPRPKPEPTADEAQLAAEIAADPALEDLLAEQAAFNDKVTNPSRKRK